MWEVQVCICSACWGNLLTHCELAIAKKKGKQHVKNKKRQKLKKKLPFSTCYGRTKTQTQTKPPPYTHTLSHIAKYIFKPELPDCPSLIHKLVPQQTTNMFSRILHIWLSAKTHSQQWTRCWEIPVNFLLGIPGEKHIRNRPRGEFRFTNSCHHCHRTS